MLSQVTDNNVPVHSLPVQSMKSIVYDHGSNH